MLSSQPDTTDNKQLLQICQRGPEKSVFSCLQGRCVIRVFSFVLHGNPSDRASEPGIPSLQNLTVPPDHAGKRDRERTEVYLYFGKSNYHRQRRWLDLLIPGRYAGFILPQPQSSNCKPGCSASFSCFSCHCTYFRICSSFNPIVLTQ